MEAFKHQPTPSERAWIETAGIDSKGYRKPGFLGDMLRIAAKGWGWSPKQHAVILKLMAQAAETAPKPLPVARGRMDTLVAIFAKAAGKLKHPAVTLPVPGEPALRLTYSAGGKVPGSISVADAAPFGQGRWFGRIMPDGTLAPTKTPLTPAHMDLLDAFADDPAGVAAAHGKASGACCFCSRALEDQRSLEVGYGPVCATNYGLPWGAPKAKQPLLAA